MDLEEQSHDGGMGGEPWRLVACLPWVGGVLLSFVQIPYNAGGVSGVGYDYNSYNNVMAMTTTTAMAMTTAAKDDVASSACRLAVPRRGRG
jgi:hypothetical protein